MGTEQFANGSVVYKSSADDSKTCIDQLKDDAQYTFTCRCGCGAAFAGRGSDIKATGEIGRAEPTKTTVTSITGPPRTLNATCSVEDINDIATLHGVELTSSEIVGALNELKTEEAPLPFVSDRYLKKAQFGLSDEEIDTYGDTHDDPLEEMDSHLSERQPPAIADLVYSLASGEGPYSLLEYVHEDVKLPKGKTKKILCGLLRTPNGKYFTLPLADLALHWPGRPVKQRGSGIFSLLLAVSTAMIGSAIVVSYFNLLR